MPDTAYHVIADNRGGGWDVRREPNPEAHHHFDTREEALEYGRRASLEEGLDLVVHDPHDNTAWTVSRRKRTGVEMVIEENESLPADIRDMLKKDPHSHFISRGPIQPKARPTPRGR